MFSFKDFAVTSRHFEFYLRGGFGLWMTIQPKTIASGRFTQNPSAQTIPNPDQAFVFFIPSYSSKLYIIYTLRVGQFGHVAKQDFNTIRQKLHSFCHNRNLQLPIQETMVIIVRKL